MRVDHYSYGMPTRDIATSVRALEEVGVDGWFTAEAGFDPVVPATIAAAHSDRIAVGTGILIAFARAPMTTAYLAHGLQEAAEGRFLLGIGSQIKAHVERRFSMPWANPVARMAEYIAAYHAIWDCWEKGIDLDFRGDYYEHTLMPPAFRPRDIGWDRPPVLLAAVGPAMTELAGRAADGVMCHPFSGARYLREVTVPTIRRASSEAGRDPNSIMICGTVLVATGANEELLGENIRATKGKIAFYASTPAYRRVLDLSRWGDLHAEALALARAKRWAELPDLVDDAVLDEFAVVAEPRRLGTVLAHRYGGLLDRINLATDHEFTGDEWSLLLDALHPA
jgi:probable F420-dependent oxidoreductase